MGVSTGTAVVQQTNYAPWGAVENQTGWSFDSTRLGWKGDVWEGGKTNLYYVRNRWYDPVSRGFISEDPIGIAGGLNTYSYAGNDPVNGWDPDGLSAAAGSDCIITVEYKYWLDTGEIVNGSLRIVAKSPGCSDNGDHGGQGEQAHGGGGSQHKPAQRKPEKVCRILPATGGMSSCDIPPADVDAYWKQLVLDVTTPACTSRYLAGQLTGAGTAAQGAAALLRSSKAAAGALDATESVDALAAIRNAAAAAWKALSRSFTTESAAAGGTILRRSTLALGVVIGLGAEANAIRNNCTMSH